MRHGRLWLTSIFVLLFGCLLWSGAQPKKDPPKADNAEPDDLSVEDQKEAAIIKRFRQVRL